MVKSNVYIIFLLLMAMALLSSSSHGLSLGNFSIGQGEIYGVLRCNLSGDHNAPPVSGAPIYLRYGGSSTNISDAVTNPNGTFTVVLNAIETALVRPRFCNLLANLPGGNCSLSLLDGFLTATFSLLRIVQTNTINIAVFIANSFVEYIF